MKRQNKRKNARPHYHVEEQPHIAYEFTLFAPLSATQQEIKTLQAEVARYSSSFYFSPAVADAPAQFVIRCTAEQGQKLYARLHQLLDLEAVPDPSIAEQKAQLEGAVIFIAGQYFLPRDAQQLHLHFAASGLSCALSDGRHMLSEQEVRQRIGKLCTEDLQNVPQRTNDPPLYREIVVDSFLIGYRLGRLDLLGASEDAMNTIAAQIQERLRAGHPGELQHWYIESLKMQLEREQLATVDELLALRLQERR